MCEMPVMCASIRNDTILLEARGSIPDRSRFCHPPNLVCVSLPVLHNKVIEDVCLINPKVYFNEISILDFLAKIIIRVLGQGWSFTVLSVLVHARANEHKILIQYCKPLLGQ